MKLRKLWLLFMLFAFVSTAVAGSITGTVTCTGMRDNANAIVFIEKIPGKTFPPPEEPVVMDQRGKEFLPRVLPIVVGTTVDFLNSDPFNHNVFTPDKCAGRFDLETWPTGEKRGYTFTSPCEAAMLCSVHPEMMASILVVETPYFSVTADDGSYTMSDVPDGTYEVSVWHEMLPKTTQTVKVSGESTADFTLKR